MSNFFKTPFIMDPYRVTELLGSGSFGCVYRAEHKTTSAKEYAIKFIKKDHITSNPKLLGYFKDEIRITQKINHKNIVRLITPYEIRDHYALVYEYCEQGKISFI